MQNDVIEGDFLEYDGGTRFLISFRLWSRGVFPLAASVDILLTIEQNLNDKTTFTPFWCLTR